MLSKRWDTAGRWCIYALLLIVFVGPFWGIVATAFSGAPVKPGELLALAESVLAGKLHLCVDGYRRLAVPAELYLVVFFGTVLQVSVSALAAYALARKKFRGVALVSPVILSTMMLPEEVIAIPLYMIINWRLPLIDASLYNSYLGMILPVVGWAFSIFVLTEFMSAIPKELEEAARIDGANEWQIFFHVILPLVKPALGTVVTFGFIMIWDQYLLPLIVVNRDSLNTIPVILGTLRTDESITPNIFIAITLLAMLPSIIVYLGLQKHFNRGIMSGAVKG